MAEVSVVFLSWAEVSHVRRWWLIGRRNYHASLLCLLSCASLESCFSSQQQHLLTALLSSLPLLPTSLCCCYHFSSLHNLTFSSTERSLSQRNWCVLVLTIRPSCDDDGGDGDGYLLARTTVCDRWWECLWREQSWGDEKWVLPTAAASDKSGWKLFTKSLEGMMMMLWG